MRVPKGASGFQSEAGGSRTGSPASQADDKDRDPTGALRLGLTSSYLFGFSLYTFGIGRIFAQTVID